MSESATSKITFPVLTEIFQNKGHRYKWRSARADPLTHIIFHYTAPNLLRFPGYAAIICLPGKNKITVTLQTYTFQFITMGWKNVTSKHFFSLLLFFLKVIISKQIGFSQFRVPKIKQIAPRMVSPSFQH